MIDHLLRGIEHWDDLVLHRRRRAFHDHDLTGLIDVARTAIGINGQRIETLLERDFDNGAKQLPRRHILARGAQAVERQRAQARLEASITRHLPELALV